MQNKELLSPADQLLENMLTDLIISVKNAKKELTQIPSKIIDENLQNLFKDVELDFEDVLPNLLVSSALLGLLIYRLFRYWNKDLPALTSEVATIELLDKAMDSELPIDPSLWDGVKSATRILQELITEEQQKHFRATIAVYDLQTILREDTLGTLLQGFLPQSLRKALAANYTSMLSSELLAKLAVEKDEISVIDPFCGSGRLLTAVLDQSESQPDMKLQVIGNELLGIATILTLARLLYWFQTHNLKPNLYLTSGDAFERTPPLLPFSPNTQEFFKKYDLVIMNPPFTRYLRLQSAYLKRLFQLYEPYSAYMEKQMGLHVFALFLADRILKPGGRIAAVLPAPTFYSQYANGLKKFLIKNYQLQMVIGTTIGKAFSEGSDLKEILFIADKQKPTSTAKTTFATIETPLTKDNISPIVKGLRSHTLHNLPLKAKLIEQKELESNWNWIRFLEIGVLQDLAERIRQVGKLQSANELNLRIIRGFEMYGPEFFFIPNKNWEIVKGTTDSEMIVVQHKETNKQFKFSSEWLIPALRRPGLYNSRITPKIEHYALKISQSKDAKLLEPYVSANPETWQVARKRFGSDWITHIHTQLRSKRPYGHLFIVDKFGVTTTGILAHFTDECLTASKNFYVIDCPAVQAKLLAAWLNSTIFILLFLASRREIGGAYGRLQIIDYQNEPLFINPQQIDLAISKEIEKVFDNFRSQSLPPLKEQLTLNIRKRLDRLFLRALGFQEAELSKLGKTIYEEVNRLFMEVDNRSKHKRRRN